MGIAAICDQSHVVLIRQTGNHTHHFLPNSSQFLLLYVDIHHEQVRIPMSRISLSRGTELECTILCHELIGQLLRTNVLSIVGWKLRDIAAEAATHCLLVKVDFAVRVEDGLASTRQWSVFELGAGELLLRSVVEGCRDGTLALQDLGARCDVVDEAQGVYLVHLFCH